MYGGHEFADNGGDRGLEALWTATQVAGATPEATEAPPGPPAQPPQAPGWPEGLPVDPEGGDREAGGDAQDPQLPKASDLDDRRLQGARSLHKAMENKDQVHLRLTGWKPVASKPRQAELHFVICERDPKQRPKNWKTHKMVEFLLGSDQPGAPDGAQPGPDRTPEAPGPGPEQVPAPAPAAAEEEQRGEKKARWSRDKNVRMLHCCVELKTGFLRRDRKLSRQEMDAHGSDKFWHDAARLYNNKTTVFHVLKSKTDPEKYKSFNGSMRTPTTTWRTEPS